MNEKLGKLNITIDPRMELLAIVQYFSKYADRFYGLVTRERDIYTDRVMDYFQQYKNHAIINLFDDSILENYYGYGKGSYNIILVPLFSNGNYGHQIKDNEGQEHIYAILNASHVEDRITKELLINLLWHEFSHSFKIFFRNLYT